MLNKIEKFKSVSTISANAEADIELINKYAVKELTPQEVFCFSLILCDNEVDRDQERFTNEALEELAPLFLGKSVLFDHRWSAEKQVARLYRTFVEETKEKTAMKEPKRVLRGSAYMLRDGNEELIKAIEGGITKEVSVGCQMGDCVCSICGTQFHYNWQTGKYLCEEEHFKGNVYDGKMCVGDLVNPKDAYEVSFVAVPAQKGAGVTKDLKVEEMTKEEKTELINKLQLSLASDEELAERTKILENNKKYIGGN